MKRNRREFLEEVGSGMLIAGLGTSLACDLGISAALADEDPQSLSFGSFAPLVGLMQETPPEKLQPILVGKLKQEDVDLRQLIAAAALANAETFGGQDYVGFHTEMALLPAYQMAQELPEPRQALPVLKVLYRNSDRIQESGLAKNKTLKPVRPAGEPDSESPAPGAKGGGRLLRDATRAADMGRAERIFAAQVDVSLKRAFDALLWSVQDSSDVHRFVLAHRAWGLIDVVGRKHAHTMLRQSVRFCVDREQQRTERKQPVPAVRRLVPKLIDEYGLLDRKPGKKRPTEEWLENTSLYIYEHNGEQAMDAVAAALGEGIAPEAVGEAISLAANQLVLRQGKLNNGGVRCHGDSPGVHASDAVNAWRNMARHSTARNAIVGLLVAAYYTGGNKYASFEAPYPHPDDLEAVKPRDSGALLAEAEAAIRGNDQGRAAAAIQIYGGQGHPHRPVFKLMLRYGISEDGRLHSEKYYRTVTEEFATTRPALRWRQLVALARVTASAYGFDRQDKSGHRAPGYEEACRLLGVTA